MVKSFEKHIGKWSDISLLKITVLKTVLVRIGDLKDIFKSCCFKRVGGSKELLVQKIYSKTHPVSCTNTHHDVTDLVSHGMVKIQNPEYLKDEK